MYVQYIHVHIAVIYNGIDQLFLQPTAPGFSAVFDGTAAPPPAAAEQHRNEKHGAFANLEKRKLQR